MRKTVILAFATAVLAIATMITDLVRVDAGANDSKVSARPAVQQVQALGGSNVKI